MTDHTRIVKRPGRASGVDLPPLDDRVLQLLHDALTHLLTSEQVAIEIGVARQRLAEWIRDARRYRIVKGLAPQMYQALVARSIGEGISLDVLIEGVGAQQSKEGAHDPHADFFKRQGYWDDLVGPGDVVDV